VKQPYVLRRQVIPQHARDAVKRLMNLELLNDSTQSLRDYQRSMHWFPGLRWHQDVVALVDHLPHEWKHGVFCEPQLLLHFPHDPTVPEPEITYHLDREPPWAQGRKYVRIVGVALSPWTSASGGVCFPGRVGGRGPRGIDVAFTPTMAAGDVLCIQPDQLHSPGINRTGDIRYAVYFRWLEPVG
jgi:hypothetical protein